MPRTLTPTLILKSFTYEQMIRGVTRIYSSTFDTYRETCTVVHKQERRAQVCAALFEFGSRLACIWLNPVAYKEEPGGSGTTDKHEVSDTEDVARVSSVVLRGKPWFANPGPQSDTQNFRAISRNRGGLICF